MASSLFERGMAGFFSASHDEINAEILRARHEDRLVEEPYGFALLYWPKSPFELPQILHFYSEGTRAQTRALVKRVLDFVRYKGYNSFRAVNGSGAPDPVWIRTFRDKDWTQKPTATVFDFEVVKK